MAGTYASQRRGRVGGRADVGGRGRLELGIRRLSKTWVLRRGLFAGAHCGIACPRLLFGLRAYAPPLLLQALAVAVAVAAAGDDARGRGGYDVKTRIKKVISLIFPILSPPMQAPQPTGWACAATS